MTLQELQEALNVLFRILNERFHPVRGILDSTSSDAYAIPIKNVHTRTGNSVRMKNTTMNL